MMKKIAYVVKSAFIKNKIKGKSFSDEKFREYIEDLEFLEHAILDGIGGFAGNMKLHGLKSQYEKEYEALLKELKPKEYEKYRIKKEKERKRDIAQEKRWREEERKELESEKKEWLRAGGDL